MQPPAAEAPRSPEELPFLVFFPKKTCAHCGLKTTETYSRTLDGKQYCIDCLNKGAGLEEYKAIDILWATVTEEAKENARKNGFMTYSD